MQAIGLDLGTTSICGVLIDTDTGKILRSYTENSDAFIKGKNAWERIQDPERIVSIALRIINELMSADVKAIGVTGQMHGIVYADKDGKAVSPLYTWQDGRGDQPYLDTTYAGYLHSHCGYGHVTDLYNTVNGLVPPDAACFCTVHDYLVMRLCGLKRAVIHESDAASFGCYDMNERKFIRRCDIAPVSDFCVAGTYRGVPVGVAIGDNQASVFSCLTDDDGILLNVGTGSQISVLSDSIIETDLIESRPYFNGKYLTVGSALCGGRAYAVLKDFYMRVLGYATDASEEGVYCIMAQMLKGKENSSLTVDTRFSGDRADGSLRGSISGISTDNFTPEELTFGVLYGMIKELKDMYDGMGVRRSVLVGSGNGIRRNPALRTIAEKAFSMPMSVPAHLEEAAYGAALYALVSCGLCKDPADAHRLVSFTAHKE